MRTFPKRGTRFPRVICVLCSLWFTAPLFSPTAHGATDFPAPTVGCLATDKCHAGIKPIREHSARMAREIYARGAKLGAPNGCVVCHGGAPGK